MNLKLIGIVTVILFFVTASNLTNYVFAQTDLESQMDTAKKAALAGMKHVKSAMKSGGLKSGVEAAKGTMKSMDEVKFAMKQNGSSTSMDDKKMNHFNQIREKLMQSKFKPNPLAAAR